MLEIQQLDMPIQPEPRQEVGCRQSDMVAESCLPRKAPRHVNGPELLLRDLCRPIADRATIRLYDLARRDLFAFAP